MRRSEKARQRPAGVVVDVRGEAQLGAATHDTRHRLDHADGDDAPLVMASFWPGIGVEHENARKECVRGRLDKGLSVAAPQAHVGELLALDPGKRRDDAVEKRLAADDPNIGVGLGLLNEMLACAEPDLQPHFTRRRGESMPCGQRLRRNRKQRQRFGEQTLLARAKRLAGLRP